jgi:hypothetical protein
MPPPNHADLLYGCITHVPLWLPFPDYVTPIYLGDAQAPGQCNLRDLAPEWEPYHRILGGTVGSFALKNLVLRDYPHAQRVGMCQYRKFVSRKRISGVPDPSYLGMDRVFMDDLPPAVMAEVMHPADQSFVVCRPHPFDQNINVLAQYQRAHHVQDLLRFTAMAVELGVLEPHEAGVLFEQTVFFPGGVEFGIYPADFWVRSVTALESVVRACVQTYAYCRLDYQTRAWSFCCERLGSYLLLKHFRSHSGHRKWSQKWHRTEPLIWQRHVGQMNLITRQKNEGYTLG